MHVFRLYEWAGKSGDVQRKVPAGAKKVQLDNLMEQSEGSALSLKDGNIVIVPVHPYELVTVQVDYPTPNRNRKSEICDL
jgi:alpha-mannosidase